MLAPTVVPTRGAAPRRPVSRPFFHGLRRSRIHCSVHLAWPRRRWWWMFSKQSADALERSCSTGRGAGSSVDGVPRLVVLVLAARSAVLAKVRLNKSGRGIRVRGEHGWVGVVLCACRGVGGDSPGPWPGHWHARIAQRSRVGELQPEMYSRERPVSRMSEKNEKSATCKPSTLRRSVWSCPTRGQRSACTSSPRRPRARHCKWAG